VLIATADRGRNVAPLGWLPGGTGCGQVCDIARSGLSVSSSQALISMPVRNARHHIQIRCTCDQVDSRLRRTWVSRVPRVQSFTITSSNQRVSWPRASALSPHSQDHCRSV